MDAASSTAPAARLAALAAGLCQDARIGVEVREKASWAWDPVRRVITVPSADLVGGGDARCAGIIAHEVGHFFVSRYLHFADALAAPPHVRLLLNALEDPRVEAWIARRYPGTAPWLEAAATSVDDPAPALPLFLRFCLECAREGAGLAPRQLPPEVEDALRATGEARREYASLLPPPDLAPPPDREALAGRYRTRAWPRLATEWRGRMPPAGEQAVRLLALDALDLARREVLPVAEALRERDAERLARALEGDAALRRRGAAAVERSDAREALELLAAATRSQAAPEAGTAARSLARRLLDLVEGDAANAATPGPASAQLLGGSNPAPDPERRARLPARGAGRGTKPSPCWAPRWRTWLATWRRFSARAAG